VVLFNTTGKNGVVRSFLSETGASGQVCSQAGAWEQEELSPRSDNKVEIILILSENRLPPSPPVHYMVLSVRISYSQRSGHNPSLKQRRI